MMNMVLRDYQAEMLDRLLCAWQKSQSVMVQMPTGTGKTVLMAEVIRRSLIPASEGQTRWEIADQVRDEGGESFSGERLGVSGITVNCHLSTVNCQLSPRGRILIVAHRRELIEQISETLRGFGIDHGLILAGKEIDETKAVQVASIQTLSLRIGQPSALTLNFSLIIVDEAHHAIAKTYRMLWDTWPEARFLGLTATPCRLNNTGFTDLFGTLLQSWSIQEFIDKGWLSDFEYVSAAPDNKMVRQVKELKKRGVGGDYQEKEMCAVLDVPESIEHLYNTYRSFANGRKGIVYAINRDHARHIADYYQERGVSCSLIDSKTPEKERTQLVEAYREQKIDVLVNVDIFGEGFDVPEVEFIQLARPTLSLSKYLQQVGRGMRISEGKEAVLILDQVGLYQIFGLPTDERDWHMLFLGKQAGKGCQDNVRGIVIRDDPDNKELVNLEMVRIKRRGETHTGLEIFLQEGKYGIMNNGRVTCPPELEKITRLEAPYFAMGIYPYYVFRNRLALIDMQGHDMKPGLYGNVRKEGDVFIGKTSDGVTVYWDAKGGRKYQSMPTFKRIKRFEVAMVGNQLYMRQNTKQWEWPVVTKSVYLHDDYTIFGDKLVFNNNIGDVHRIRGYEKNGIYIEYTLRGDPNVRYACVGRSGTISSFTRTLPQQLSLVPVSLGSMNLRNL